MKRKDGKQVSSCLLCVLQRNCKFPQEGYLYRKWTKIGSSICSVRGYREADWVSIRCTFFGLTLRIVSLHDIVETRWKDGILPSVNKPLFVKETQRWIIKWIVSLFKWLSQSLHSLTVKPWFSLKSTSFRLFFCTSNNSIFFQLCGGARLDYKTWLGQCRCGKKQI